jgi:hypothetical protein
VLTKLQKWGDYASVGFQVLHTKFIPMKVRKGIAPFPPPGIPLRVVGRG